MNERDDEAGLAGFGFEWPRYPRILVAIDEAPAAVFALRHVVPYAVDQRSRLTLLTVVPNAPGAVAAAGVSPQRLVDEMERRSAAYLHQVAATLPRDVSVTTILRRGDPAEEILGLVREQPVDLICMGARGRGRVSGALLGPYRRLFSITARCRWSCFTRHQRSGRPTSSDQPAPVRQAARAA